MPLGEPPQGAGSLAGCASEPLRNRTIFRVWRHLAVDGSTREEPWWFAAIPVNGEAGRYDLAAPMGTCYAATRPEAALLEALGAWLTLIPVEELRVRRLATIATPGDAPPAAKVTARSSAGEWGLTAALWAGADRAATHAWAAAFRRDGWWALYGGIQHDPSGQLRGIALFDHAGAHPPTYGDEWTYGASTLHDDDDVRDGLARFGVAVREPGDLPYADPPR